MIFAVSVVESLPGTGSLTVAGAVMIGAVDGVSSGLGCRRIQDVAPPSNARMPIDALPIDDPDASLG